MSTDPAWPEGVGLIEVAETDSTMAEAARRAGTLTAATWIRADRQTNGRGRAGRSWISTEGALAATLVYRPGGSAQDAALRSFVAANALHRALARFVRPERLSLKWPNDVLLDGQKVAGILLESETRGSGVSWLAVGIGVNLDGAPAADAGAAFPPTSLGIATTPARFLTVLASAYASEEADFVAHGFGPVRLRWLARAARLGESIVARTRTEAVTGTFETVDETGGLRLMTAGGLRVVTAADVFFG